MVGQNGLETHTEMCHGEQQSHAHAHVHAHAACSCACVYCQVGVSEMFNHMGSLPTFTLHSAGLCPGATPTHFWRVYSLRSPGMACEITETFIADVLDRPPTGPTPAKRASLDHSGF